MRRPKRCHEELIESALTERIIGAFYQVYNTLGYGHLESVYNRALAIEVVKRGMHAAVQVPTTVFYGDEIVGEFRADLVVENRIIVELKAGKLLPPDAELQLINYLKCTDLEVGLLFHFGPEPKFRRLVWTNPPRPGPRASANSARSAPPTIRRGEPRLRDELPGTLYRE